MDYTGVPTAALAELVDRHLNSDEEFDLTSWAKLHGFNQTHIDDIRRGDYQMTSLSVADRICIAFGLNVSFELPVLPMKKPGSAKKLARDEWIVANAEDVLADPDTIELDHEWIAQRAATLDKQRDAILGPMNEHQLAVKITEALKKQKDPQKREAMEQERARLRAIWEENRAPKLSLVASA